jgi:hypothetical protein
MQIRHLWYFSQKRRNLEGFFAPRPRLFDTELILNNQVKYLGVILDSKLNLKFHIDNRIRKASIVYWQYRRAIGKTWGLKPKVVYRIYSSVIRPMLNATLVWWKRTNVTTVKKTVWSYQRITCLGMTTPTAAMETHLCNLWFKKRPGWLHTDCTAPAILKNQTGDTLLFTR